MLLIGGIAITLLMDSYLALAMLSILPFIFVTVYFISKKGVPLYTKVQRSVDKMIRIVREDVPGHPASSRRFPKTITNTAATTPQTRSLSGTKNAPARL